ncbi:4-dihydrotrisporin dehydrogenase [Blakeslea trispora]|nr:4-dihydrotrisporin dehydrogenase [Blakeslea trispora]
MTMTPSTFVITGTSRGLGLELVRQLSSKGHTVFACARNPDASEKLQALVDHKHVIPIQMDTVNKKSIETAVKEIERQAPDGIDVLINNAAILGDLHATPEELTRDSLGQVFDVNVSSTNDVTMSLLPLLRKRGQDKIKKIVNITSTIGSIELAHELGKDRVAYCVSKAALNMLTRLTALNLAKENFIVYAACPGYVKTDMGGKDAFITPEESVTNQIAKLEKVTLEDNGKFFGNNGDIVPW